MGPVPVPLRSVPTSLCILYTPAEAAHCLSNGAALYSLQPRLIISGRSSDHVPSDTRPAVMTGRGRGRGEATSFRLTDTIDGDFDVIAAADGLKVDRAMISGRQTSKLKSGFNLLY